GFSLVGKPEVNTRRASPRILRRIEATGLSAAPAPTTAKMTGALSAMPGPNHPATVAANERTADVLPVTPPSSSTPTSANSVVPSIYRGFEAGTSSGVLSQSVLNDVAKQIFDAAMDK